MSARKAAIITGGATGVGAATALLLARRGYDVLINYSKSEAEAKESARACREAGADALLAQGDVAEDAACRRLVGAAVERWKRLDVLVNNAGHQHLRRIRATGRRWMRRPSSASTPSTCWAPSR